ncbi:MAG: helix-turn-helix transcriptional regulator [Oscillospiraceae bacterium]|nr:helix-turn-helix transcriptional regulator [Oscillospiraceae bacterium]
MSGGYYPGGGRPRKLVYQYPRLDERIKEIGTMKRFAAMTGIKLTTYYNLQAGRTSTSKTIIDIILDYTGLTYEEAFK